MDDQVRRTLREIGAQLDRNCFPIIHNGGVVVPSRPPFVSQKLGTERSDATTFRPIRPTARSWPRPPSWQRPSGRSGPSRRAASTACARYQAAYENQLNDVWDSYPDTRVWVQDDGMWLQANSAILEGLGKKATFLVAVPFQPQLRVRSWAFWTTIIGVSWLGPRHTNWPDGDICAYTSDDGTWGAGGSVVKLLDLNTLWALRQLHFEEFGRWPGYHSAPHPYERITELRGDEFCGCDRSDRLYRDCCQERDLAEDQAQIATDFYCRYMRNGLRSPPEEITQFALRRFNPPKTRAFDALL